jgi:hypothetical protein
MAARPLHLPLPAPASSSVPSSPAAATATAGASDSVLSVFAAAPEAPGDHGVRERGGIVHEQGVVQASGGARQAAAVLPERSARAGDTRGGPGAAALFRAAARVHHQALLCALRRRGAQHAAQRWRLPPRWRRSAPFIPRYQGIAL